MLPLSERLAREALAAHVVRRPRTWRRFAEEELVLASGVHKGELFRCDRVPFSEAILAEYDRTRFWRFFFSGPGQDGKSLYGYILPALYEIFERRRDVILGAPVVEMAQAAYFERLLPSIEATRYRELLPRKGGGSRGGKALSMQFEHGPRLRFMGAGGGDAQRSGYTAPVIIMTELDKMDDSGMASEEADPVTQMEERSSSFRAFGLARTYGECTMSTRRGRVYREVCEIGTNSRVFLPCVHCGEYVFPERKSFSGWQDAKEVEEARDRAHFVCPTCGKPWTEMDRRRAVRNYRLVARGQTVGKDGVVAGTLPRTHTFGFRWNSMASSFKTMADIGEAEWRADRADTESEKKMVIQFRWAEPWERGKLDLAGLTRDTILSKVTQQPRGTAPADTLKVTVFIDVGLYLCWWTAVAWRSEARGHVLDYGSIEVPQERQPDPARILPSLREFRETVLKHGWMIAGAQRRPDLTLVDSGFQHELIYRLAKESGVPRMLPSKGFGSSKNDGGAWRSGAKASSECQVGNEWRIALQQPSGVWLAQLHADYWKAEVHQGFAAPAGAPGSITIFHAEPAAHRAFARHITAEEQRQEFKQGEGMVTWWEVLRQDNHWLDCLVGARAAADMLGITKVPAAPRRPAPPPAEGAGGGRRIRTKY